MNQVATPESAGTSAPSVRFPAGAAGSPPSARRRMVEAALGLVMGEPTPERSGATSVKRRRATRAEARGAEAVGIRAVAEAAGVTHAAPLHHFPDRVSLLAAVAAEGQRRLASDLEQARAGAAALGARRLLGAVVSAHALWAARHPGLWDVMCNPQLTDGVNSVWRGRHTGMTAEQALASGGAAPAESTLARANDTSAPDRSASASSSSDAPSPTRATAAAARNSARRAEAFDELVNAKVRVFETYDAAVYACPAEQLDMSRFAGGERRPLVHALTTLADGLALQFVGERGVNEPALRQHVEGTLDLLLAGVVRR